MTKKENTAYLLLENSKVFKGKYFGKPAEVTGEVVFTTGMTGYLETLTDKSYYGQIVVQTFPLIGNYGIIPDDFESCSIGPKAYIVKEWCQAPSNFRCEGELGAFLESKGITGLYGIDTRALTKIICNEGVMNGKIVTDPSLPSHLSDIKRYIIEDSLPHVSAKESYVVHTGRKKYRVAMIDFGMKNSIAKALAEHGCEVTVFPYDTDPSEILSCKPNGIILSNGPGDPMGNTEILKNIKILVESRIPIFANGLGHQLLALAQGFATEKMKYGHRGAGQPIKSLADNKIYISNQNHGYSVVSSSIDKDVADELFVNVNDGTNEGIIYKDHPSFSVQFYPESFLIDNFITNMEESKHAVR